MYSLLFFLRGDNVREIRVKKSFVDFSGKELVAYRMNKVYGLEESLADKYIGMGLAEDANVDIELQSEEKPKKPRRKTTKPKASEEV